MPKKEDKYIQMLRALGIWNTAFEPTVHDLAVLEREVARARKAWKSTAEPGKAPSPLDPHYALIRQMQREIMTLRDALGLTPKALRRIKGVVTSEGTNDKGDIKPATVLGLVLGKREQGA